MLISKRIGLGALHGENAEMCVHSNMKACRTIRSRITNIHKKTNPLLAVRAVRQFIMRLRLGAIVQTAVLVATCSILILGLAPSPTLADVTMDSYETQATIGRRDETHDSFSGRECYQNEGLLSAGGRTLHFITDLLSQKKGGVIELSAGQRLSDRNSLTVDCGYEPFPPNDKLGWRHVFGDLGQVMNLPFGGSNFFTMASVPTEKNTTLIEVGRRSETGGFLFGLGQYSEVGNAVQNQGFDIDVSFSF
ncbi:hypothetical protein [Cognatiyoonia sp. IB215182]|uniref:hypothetical protein n=1 Tax=Cognatiyoonia sp. IB215182 TaxID=3097353 RepID=UPI002A1365D0|nr:hypothetical protein [Cognatiyoonia sp. IB215182]MDX8355336.1 hypothetical protein [Cognatiyoonia sp. IB215182]